MRMTIIIFHGKDSLNLASLVHEVSSLLVAQLVTDLVPLLGFVHYCIKRALDRWFSSISIIMEAILSKRETTLKSEEMTYKQRAHRDSGRDADLVGGDIQDVLLASEEPALISRDKIKAMIVVHNDWPDSL